MFKGKSNIYNSLKDYCVSLGIRLTQQGKYYRAHCPLPTHRGVDAVPSFTVYPNDTFYCFGCLEGGDGDRLAFLLGDEAPKILRKQQRLADINVRKPATEEQVVLMTRFYSIYSDLTPVAKEYMTNRGFENMTNIHVGYCTGRKVWLKTAERKAAYLLGLVNASGWDKMRGRVLLPEIKDDKVIWLQGRAMDNTEPKYYNVHIEKPLYGLNSLQNKDYVWLVEGVFDALTLHQIGEPAVAIIGSYLQDHQIPNFGGIMAVNICLDNDNAGRRSTEKVIAQLKNIVPFINVVHLPEDVKDLNDLLIKGRLNEVIKLD